MAANWKDLANLEGRDRDIRALAPALIEVTDVPALLESEPQTSTTRWR
jgi:hypothetical protein